MAKGKRTRTPAEKTAQQVRTARNQSNRYENLIKKNPNSPHKGAWNKSLDYYSLGGKK